MTLVHTPRPCKTGQKLCYVTCPECVGDSSPSVQLTETTESRIDMTPYYAAITVSIMRSRGYVDLDIPGFNAAHLDMMVETMVETKDEYKNCRWLGWLQAAAVVMTGGKLSLDDCRAINKGKR